MTDPKRTREADRPASRGRVADARPRTDESPSSTTAIGLLCRMYLGWKKDNEALRRGVEWIAARGPAKSPANMYDNYYATQVMRHWEGEMVKCDTHQCIVKLKCGGCRLLEFTL